MFLPNGLIVNRLIIIFFFFLFVGIQLHAQKYIGNTGEISFFSEAPMEDIAAINKKVSAVFDASSNDLVFQLRISDFIFPKALMQEHFNENYLESDIYPTSTFVGKVLESKAGEVSVQGDLTIHGRTNRIKVHGFLLLNKELVNIESNFMIKLEDYDIAIPKIVMYKIADEIDIKVNIKLEKVQ